jgi:hypothetical protein
MNINGIVFHKVPLVLWLNFCYDVSCLKKERVIWHIFVKDAGEKI